MFCFQVYIELDIFHLKYINHSHRFLTLFRSCASLSPSKFRETHLVISNIVNELYQVTTTMKNTH